MNPGRSDRRRARVVRWTDGIQTITSWLVEYGGRILAIEFGRAALGPLADVATGTGISEDVVEQIRLVPRFDETNPVRQS